MESMSRVASLSSGRMVMEEATVDDVRGPALTDPMGVVGREMRNCRWERSEE